MKTDIEIASSTSLRPISEIAEKLGLKPDDYDFYGKYKAKVNDIEILALLLANAGVNYIIGVPAGDDIMLNYQTNSYHDTASIRQLLGLKATEPFDEWLIHWGILNNNVLTDKAGDASIFLKGL